LDARAKPTHNLDTCTDLEIIAAVNRGDLAAFEVLYLRYRDWVVRLAYRFTRDEEAALDVLQETFLYFLKKFPGFRLTANLKTFLYPAVRNLSATAREKARRFQSSESELREIEDAKAPERDTANMGDLQIVLGALSEEHREVLLLRFLEGFDLSEIALSMDIPVGTVKSRLHNALQVLRNDSRTREYFDQ